MANEKIIVFIIRGTPNVPRVFADDNRRQLLISWYAKSIGRDFMLSNYGRDLCGGPSQIFWRYHQIPQRYT